MCAAHVLKNMNITNTLSAAGAACHMAVDYIQPQRNYYRMRRLVNCILGIEGKKSF